MSALPPVPGSSSPNGAAGSRAGTEPAWTEGMLVNPHAVGDKAERVRTMFGAIAPSYDLNNRLHSLGMDQHWRNVAVKMARVLPTDVVVDVACGTGDLTIKLHRAKARMAWATHLPAKTFGIDFTPEMLPIARLKASGCRTEAERLAAIAKDKAEGEAYQRQLEEEDGPEFAAKIKADVDALYAKSGIHFIQGDAMALPLGDGSVDVVTIAFGIRNVADWRGALREFGRVLKPGGRVVVLEFSLPRNRVLRGLYNFYFRRVLPVTATWVSGDRTGAYRYLPESVNTFITREEMVSGMAGAGFKGIEARALTFGVCVCYKGVKK